MLLYAETHYPRYWISRIRRAEPEIVVDMPWRVEPGTHIPVALIVNDAHRYPVQMHSLKLVMQTGVSELTTVEFELDRFINEPYWWRMFSVEPPLSGGIVSFTPVIRYSIRGKLHEAIADNYRGSSHAPFAVRVAAEQYPRDDGWQSGDIHVHTEFTRDQIEFGPPVDALAAAAKAMGMQWFAATDHSYDLDDSDESYLRNDPGLPRWRKMLRACAVPRDGVCIIPGEEVSCGNRTGRNVHLLALGIRQHIAGKGDSAERPFRTHPDHAIPDVIANVHEQGGIAIAAHPGYAPPIAERAIFRRGKWDWRDLTEPRLAGVQAWNGRDDAGFVCGMEQWVRLLLSGARIPMSAGNDSHGAFGRARHVTIPWIALADDHLHLFGSVRTVVQTPELSEKALLAGIAAGRSYVTNGPGMRFQAASAGATGGLGDTVPYGKVALRAEGFSTLEFGRIERLGIACGVIGEDEEWWRWFTPDTSALEFQAEMTEGFERPGYVRVEVQTDAGKRAISNPIWISGSERFA